MEKESIYEYYRMGWNYKNMRQGKEGHAVSTVIDDIDDFINFLVKLNLQVTAQIIGSKLSGLQDNLKTLDAASVLSQEKSQELIGLMKSIDSPLDAELSLRHAYRLTDKRLGLSILLDNIGSMFDVQIYEKLPDLAKFDFSEAGKSIAFELPTAAAFHILRATEETLRHYYKNKVKKNRLNNLLWKNMTDELCKKRDVPKAILDECDYVRIHFRNPTIHPEATYTIDEVQNLFSLCCNIVNKIVKDQKKNN